MEEFFAQVTRSEVFFIIDGSKKMFDMDNSDQSYFNQCLSGYHEILIEKCRWNMKDLMGLIVCGINTNNVDPNIKDALIIHELQTINLDMVKKIKTMLNTSLSFQSVDTCSLLDVLHYVFNKLTSSIQPTIFKKVVLLTCNDSPFVDNEKARHELRSRAKTMRDLDLQFDIIGFGKDWDDKKFWKDIRLMFGIEDIPKSLNDIKINIIKPARLIRRSKLHIVEGVSIPVDIHSILKSSVNINKSSVHAETSRTLENAIVYAENSGSDDETEITDDSTLNTKVYTSEIYGGKKATLSGSEMKEIRRQISKLLPPGIHVIGFDDINYNWDMHIKQPYFVTCSKEANSVDRTLFIDLLRQSTDMNQMAICMAALFQSPTVYLLIPYKEKGGFYLYQFPFKNQVRDLKTLTEKQIDKNVPIDESQIALFGEMIDSNTIDLKDCSFRNPQHELTLARIQAIALEEEEPTDVPDNTDVDVNTILKKVGKPMENFTTLYAQTKPVQKKRYTEKSASDVSSQDTPSKKKAYFSTN